ncbi:MAG: glycosyltransferase [Candidatus Omnitrophota bacterium]
MNILMVTNTYKPIVGGFEKSIEAFSSEYRSRGHEVLIIAPTFKNMPEEEGVHRIPAIQNFNGTDFSVEVPVPGMLKDVLKEFKPDIVHSHHPFLAGDTAFRISSSYNIPLIFTYHTMYEMNTHYVPGNSEVLKKFAIELALGYTELCDRVIVPSESVKAILKERGSRAQMDVIPTGIKVSEFLDGNGNAFRRDEGIPETTFLIGHLGRMEEEKNILFLGRAVLDFMKGEENSHFLAVGGGTLLPELKKMFGGEGLNKRVHFPGVLTGQEKVDAYHAMDIFTFASKSETQGLVLAEAMASGVPVIGLDAPGVRDIVEDRINGFLLNVENEETLCEALDLFRKMDKYEREEFSKKAKITAEKFDYKTNTQKVLDVYSEAINERDSRKKPDKNIWESSKRYIKTELELISNTIRSAESAIKGEDGV